MRGMKCCYIAVVLVLAGVLAAGLGLAEAGEEPHFDYRYASLEECRELLSNNTAYYEGFSQNDLDFRMQKKGATLEEYKAFAVEQAREFSQEEKAVIDAHMANIEKTLKDNGYVLPDLDQVVFFKTTQKEEGGSDAYTHGTDIFLGDFLLAVLAYEDQEVATIGESTLWHELFHCLTRCNPDFRADMYSIINFTVREEDYQMPPSVFEYYISNPDVGHHNSYASFIIDGKAVDCFAALVTTKHFEEEGDAFFKYIVTALVPTDGSDMYYTSEEASNFDDIFGKNTDYVIDPEECLADNFSYAMTYGLEGKNGQGYPNPEIIEAILDYVSGT